MYILHLALTKQKQSMFLPLYHQEMSMLIEVVSFQYLCSLRGVMVRALACDTKSHARLPTVLLQSSNFGQVVHTHVPVTKQYNLLPVTGQQCLQLER